MPEGDPCIFKDWRKKAAFGTAINWLWRIRNFKLLKKFAAIFDRPLGPKVERGRSIVLDKQFVK